jgi:hypothetical protein
VLLQELVLNMPLVLAFMRKTRLPKIRWAVQGCRKLLNFRQIKSRLTWTSVTATVESKTATLSSHDPYVAAFASARLRLKADNSGS